MLLKFDLTDQTAVWETEKYTPEEEPEEESPKMESHDCGLREWLDLSPGGICGMSKLKPAYYFLDKSSLTRVICWKWHQNWLPSPPWMEIIKFSYICIQKLTRFFGSWNLTIIRNLVDNCQEEEDTVKGSNNPCNKSSITRDFWQRQIQPVMLLIISNLTCDENTDTETQVEYGWIDATCKYMKIDVN